MSKLNDREKGEGKEDTSNLNGDNSCIRLRLGGNSGVSGGIAGGIAGVVIAIVVIAIIITRSGRSRNNRSDNATRSIERTRINLVEVLLHEMNSDTHEDDAE